MDNVNPFIYHFNNGSWRKLSKVRQLMNNLYSNIKKIENYNDNNIEILVINTNPEKSLLEKSLDKLGVKYILLGKGLKWSGYHLMNKLPYDYLINNNNNSKPYILYMDANDVIINDDPNKLIDRFIEYDTDLILSAESNFFCNSIKNKCNETTKEYHKEMKIFEDNLYTDISFKRPPLYEKDFCDELKQLLKGKKKDKWFMPRFTDDIHQRYANCGCYFGKREFVLKYLQEIVDYYKKYDYICSSATGHILHKRYYPKIKLDYKSNLFQSMISCYEVPKKV